MKILVLHGPNLNLLGERAPRIYGKTTLSGLNQLIKKEARKLGFQTKIHQSNFEGQIIEWLHKNRKWADGVLINPGALTHYSYAIRDAIEAIAVPTIEVHLSDIHRREAFRRVSVISPVCIRQVAGLGAQSYVKALEHFKKLRRR